GEGTAFKITKSGGVSPLHTFTGMDGAEAFSGLTLSTGGYYWGTTASGGLYGRGTVFKMSAPGALTTLHDFTGGADGSLPGAPPVEGIDGNFYGTTGAGGNVGSNGTVYRISSSGSFQTVHSFGGTGQGTPNAPLVQGSDGFLYGTTYVGGKNGAGTIFKVSVSGHFQTIANFGVLFCYSPGSLGSGQTRFHVLHDFQSATGSSPQVTLLQHTNGKLYGDTAVGGSVNLGTFYSFDAGLGPFVSFMPQARKVGHGVKILGQGFTGATAVSFNGTPASFVVVSDTFIKARVPNGATSGFLTVKTPSGTLTSNRTFLVKPQIVGFSPASSLVGATVVIDGVSLKQT